MTESRKRRTPAEVKADLAEKIKAIDLRMEVADKQQLLRLADALSVLAKRRPIQPTIGQAATLVSQAAAAIKAAIPQ